MSNGELKRKLDSRKKIIALQKELADDLLVVTEEIRVIRQEIQDTKNEKLEKSAKVVELKLFRLQQKVEKLKLVT